jgi:CBS domain-containing protein
VKGATLKINDVMRAKSGPEAITITPEASVRDLLALMSENNIGAVVVSSDGTTVDGIVSERDVVRKLHGDDSVLGAPVQQIMTAGDAVHTCGPGDDLDSLRSLMTDKRIRHVPVVDSGRLVGVVSIGDVVKSHINQVEFERDQLDHYVHQT